ncbi:IS1595 family transposase [Oceanirhabdus seepicola]|uniref:IS1595 family transposase n=1 Tax=Oceanirhabdus seepicola TaxID=2828781 RepID=A0A9J6NVX3_9CLOT|nr:IS1595 family transposase [Oceanirhabdus seepicola]MCM1988150.1 IS1595 family transposase [Oceanirhabdus seepicola]
MTYFFSRNRNQDSNDQKKVDIKDGVKDKFKENFKENLKENLKDDYKDDFLDKFEKNVLDSNLSDEIKSNLMKMVNISRSRERKKFEENQMKAEERARREEKRISRLKILERIIKVVDIENVQGKEEEIIDSIRGRRFMEGGVCPHCGYKKIWKYGKYQGKQRYKCKSEECGKTFSDRTLSPMYCSKKGIDKWIEYMKCMVRGLSLSDCSRIVGINIATAFYWRHKIMDGLRENMGTGCVGGIVEMGHMVVVESIKGNRNKKGERGIFNRGRRCGFKNKYTLIFNEDKAKINYVVCAVDRRNNIIVEACNNKRVDKRVLETIFCENISVGTILCTEGNRHYHQFAQEMELVLGRSCTGDDNEEYHVGNLMGMKRELNNWLNSFKGVSSKYLTNYLYWYRWLKEKKVYDGESEECNDNNHSAAECLFLESHTKYTGMIIKDFKDRKPIYVTAA